MLDVIFVIIIFFGGFNFKKIFKSKLSLYDFKVLNYLWIYHFIFGVIYWYYVSYVAGGDALLYYERGSQQSFVQLVVETITFGPGTRGMVLLTSLPAQFFGFFATSIFSALCGYIGFVYFYIFFVTNIKFNSKIFGINLFPLLFFLPNLHFWSVGLGKDTISFLCIAMFFYSMQSPKKNIYKIILALGLSYIIRPHISVFLVAAFGIAFMLHSGLASYKKILIGFLFSVIFILLFEKLMSFINFDSLDAETIQAYTEKSVNNLSKSSTGSSVDVSSYPYPLKVFTFLYRPLFFDINNILAVIASFENLLILMISFKFIRLNPIRMFRRGDYLYKGAFIFFSIGALSFSLILGNLGIMLREKNMFMPALLFICLWSFSLVLSDKVNSESSIR